MVRKELIQALNDPSSLEKMKEKMAEIETSKEIDWETKSKNPHLTKLQAFDVLTDGIEALIEIRNDKIKQGFKIVNLTNSEILVIRNCFNEFGKQIKW